MSRLGPYELDTIVVGDCLDVMRQMPDGCVDMAFCDPVYWEPLDERWIDEVVRILSNGASMFVSWSSLDVPTIQVPIAARLQLRNLIVWQYRNNNKFTRWDTFKHTWEPIIYATKGDGRYKVRLEAMGEVWTFAQPQSNFNHQDKKKHKWQKPTGLLERVVRASSNPSDLIFDPFMGSGTTAVAAKKLGRHYFGCDISEEYVKMARERVAKIDGVQMPLSHIEMED